MLRIMSSENFQSFFEDFFQTNVGGIGATFSFKSHLENDLGFMRSDLEKLKSLVEKKWSMNLPKDALTSDVQHLFDCLSIDEKFRMWLKTGDRKTVPVIKEPVQYDNSGCNRMSEIQFVMFVRKWYEEERGVTEEEARKVVNRSTLLPEILTSEAHEKSFARALASKWSDAKLPAHYDRKSNLMIFMLHLLQTSRAFSQWDLKLGPRGG